VYQELIMQIERFLADGFIRIDDVLPTCECEKIATLVRPGMRASAGTRCLLGEFWCVSLANRLREHSSIAGLIPHDHVAVQCTYFEKSASRNWLVPIHQDLSIPVADRISEPSLSGWSEKEGAVFVHAPAAVSNDLVAVRLHLDPCKAEYGPLRVVPRSHTMGRLTEEQAIDLRQSFGEVSCEFEIGGVLVMRPLLLHSSSKASGEGRRRVLHFVYGPSRLPFGLKWRNAF
jgi:hypothetical protein